MSRFLPILAVALGAFAVLASPVAAQSVIGSYTAFIGKKDLKNSNGERLTEPWQVLRQDRANFHRFGISQRTDEWDPFFGSIDNRAAMERMVMNGTIDPKARRMIMKGGATVFVEIYGTRNRGEFVRVTVSR